MSAVTAFAPASVGNVAVGFDVLGHAIEGPGDRVRATRRERAGVRISAVRGIPCRVPVDAAHNTAGKAAASLLEATAPGFGVELEIEKGIPIGSGMGGSAASAVAAVVAVNALLPSPLGTEALLEHAMAGEALASGGRAHADNIAPCLHGGLTLVAGGDEPAVTPLPVPAALACVLVHPQLELRTSASRAALAAQVPLATVVEQIAAVAGFVAGLYREDLALIARSLHDPIAEPQRAHLVPGFSAAKQGALEAGALGASLSGSGPSVFAWAPQAATATVAAAIQAAFAARGIDSNVWISRIDAPGARVEVSA